MKLLIVLILALIAIVPCLAQTPPAAVPTPAVPGLASFQLDPPKPVPIPLDPRQLRWVALLALIPFLYLTRRRPKPEPEPVTPGPIAKPDFDAYWKSQEWLAKGHDPKWGHVRRTNRD